MDKAANKELQKKFNKKDSFYRQMLQVSKKYAQFEQQAFYCEISGLQENMIMRLEGKGEGRNMGGLGSAADCYLMLGSRQPVGDKSFEKLIIQIIKAIPRPKRPYLVIYVNSLAEGSAYNDFNKILEFMAIEYLTFLDDLFVLQASFFSRATNWLSFGTITNYINNKTQHFESLTDLCNSAHVSFEDLAKLLPQDILHELDQLGDVYVNEYLSIKEGKESKESKGKGKVGLVSYDHMHLMSREGDMVQALQMNATKSEGVKSYVKKGEIKQLEIYEYQLGQSGVPIIMELLMFYFNDRGETLRSEGIFRKSVSIDDETEILGELRLKNYNFIEKVKNPHVIANAIKRFLCCLKTPVIPYSTFRLLMEEEGQPAFAQVVVDSIRALPRVNQMTLLGLFDFIKQKVLVHSEHNKMTENNMCIVIAPCIMRSEVVSFNDLIYARKIIVVASIILQHFEEIFGSKKQQTQLIRQSYRKHRREEFKLKFRQIRQEAEETQAEKSQQGISQHNTSHFGSKLFHKTTFYFQEKLRNGSDSDEEVNKALGLITHQKQATLTHKGESSKNRPFMGEVNEEEKGHQIEIGRQQHPTRHTVKSQQHTQIKPIQGKQETITTQIESPPGHIATKKQNPA